MCGVPARFSNGAWTLHLVFKTLGPHSGLGAAVSSVGSLLQKVWLHKGFQPPVPMLLMGSCTYPPVGWAFGSGECTSSLTPLPSVGSFSGYLVPPRLGKCGWLGVIF